jgi:putative NADH-flavin reductase
LTFFTPLPSSKPPICIVMPATSTKIFILGATGYIGGAILSELLRTSASFTISALVRKDQDIAVLEKLGVRTIKGSFSDLDKIEQASHEADVVYNAADADDMGLAQAILKGLKSKKERGILIQTRLVSTQICWRYAFN